MESGNAKETNSKVEQQEFSIKDMAWEMWIYDKGVWRPTAENWTHVYTYYILFRYV